MTTLIPDLAAAARAAYRVHADHVDQAGRHLSAATVHLRADLSSTHRRLANEHAAEAGAALLEARDLYRLAEAGGAR